MKNILNDIINIYKRKIMQFSKEKGKKQNSLIKNIKKEKKEKE